jgi:uncharacterized protein
MDREAVAQLLERLHETLGAFYRGGDAVPLREVLTEDVEWHVPGGSAIAGDYSGIDAVLGYFARRRGLATTAFRMHPGEILVGDHHVAVITEATASLRGREYSWRTLSLYRLQGGRISACWLRPFDEAKFDAIWSADAS